MFGAYIYSDVITGSDDLTLGLNEVVGLIKCLKKTRPPPTCSTDPHVDCENVLNEMFLSSGIW